MKDILLCGLAESQIFIDEPMSRHTTFRIGGAADFFVTPESLEQLVFVLKACRDASVPHFILGNGSNLLVKDNGIRGVVIDMKGLNRISLSGPQRIYAEAGAGLTAVARFARANALSGMEFAEGIPGTVGGGIVMNAGAFDGEVKDVFCMAKMIDASLQIIEVDLANMAFAHRKSMVQREIVVAVEFALKEGDKDEITAKMAELAAKRADKQPLDKPSAGSAFKRPPGKYAGKLISDSGLRGFTIGGAAVSEKHCGFIINKGNATAHDVLALIERVRAVVHENFNIWLEPEIKIVGE